MAYKIVGSQGAWNIVDENYRTLAFRHTYAEAAELLDSWLVAESYFAPDAYAENPPHGAKGHRLSRNCDQCVENGS